MSKTIIIHDAEPGQCYEIINSDGELKAELIEIAFPTPHPIQLLRELMGKQVAGD